MEQGGRVEFQPMKESEPTMDHASREEKMKYAQ